MPTKASSTGSGYPSGMKNRIINGGMDIAQRGTSFASPAVGAYSLDRWKTNHSTDGTITISQSTDAPSSNEFQNSLRMTVNTSDASIAAGQYGNIAQSIEGYNIRDLIGRTFTISFWVKSTKTGVHCIALGNSGSDRSYVAEYTVNSSLTWEYKTITVAGGLPTAGTWNYTNGMGMYISFVFAMGSTYHTTAGAWQTGSFVSTANQVNCLDTVGNIFAITGVQLELGPVATPFEHRLYGTELALCQRYYETINCAVSDVMTGVIYANSQPIAVPWMFKVEKRVTPTVYSASSSCRTVGNGATGSGGQVNFATLSTSKATLTTTATGTLGAYWIDTFWATVSSEL